MQSPQNGDEYEEEEEVEVMESGGGVVGAQQPTPSAASASSPMPSTPPWSQTTVTASPPQSGSSTAAAETQRSTLKRKRTATDPSNGSGSSASAAAAAAPASSPFPSASPSPSLSPSPVSLPSLDSFLRPVPLSTQESLRGKVLSLLYPNTRKHGAHLSRNLPGPQPISITFREMSTLREHEYWCCEKSDGERAMLFITQSPPAAYLIDRKFTFQVLTHPIYTELWGKKGDTLVDGEVIQHEEHTRTAMDAATRGEFKSGHCPVPVATFMAFDLLVLHGERILDKRLSERLKGIGMGIVRPYRDRFPQYATFPLIASTSQGSSSGSDHPLAVRAKSFSPKHRLQSDIFRYIREMTSQVDGSKYYEYNDGKRKNKNDGIIFTPEADDYFCRKVPILKWKWPGLNTIDFLTRAPWFDKDGRLMLFSSANLLSEHTVIGGTGREKPETVLVHARSSMLRDERRQWFQSNVIDKVASMSSGAGRQSAHHNPSRNGVVVEMSYERDSSSWQPKLVRWDKSLPNFLTTVIGTMETIIDNVQPNDLFKACQKTMQQHQPPSAAPPSSAPSSSSSSSSGAMQPWSVASTPPLPITFAQLQASALADTPPSASSSLPSAPSKFQRIAEHSGIQSGIRMNTSSQPAPSPFGP